MKHYFYKIALFLPFVVAVVLSIDALINHRVDGLWISSMQFFEFLPLFLVPVLLVGLCMHIVGPKDSAMRLNGNDVMSVSAALIGSLVACFWVSLLLPVVELLVVGLVAAIAHAL